MVQRKLRQALQPFFKLSPRERTLIVIAVAACTFVALYEISGSISETIADTQRAVTIRTRELNGIYKLAARYKSLSGRLERLQKTFAESQMTFEQVTGQIDKIVQDSIGSDKYDLKRGRVVTKVGLDYEKQDFTLKIQSLELEEVVKLLFKLEQGDSPLFLGKVDLVKSSRSNTFSTTLEIFSLRKS